jgi:hypothetical protein
MDDVEHLTRVMAPQPFVALRPVEGAVGQLVTSGDPIPPIEISPRRWGTRLVGGEKVALTTPWAGYRWGPVPFLAREVGVLPTVTHVRSGGEAPQPIGLIGAHRSRRDGNGTEFSARGTCMSSPRAPRRTPQSC